MSNDQFSDDKPINSSQEDFFNRAPFARNLAKTISNGSLNEGYVVGLYSEWGYGKTSTLNLIKEELDKSDNVVVIEFNPWLYADTHSMIRGLFDTLATGLDAKLDTNAEKVGKFLKKIGGVVSSVDISAEVVSGAPGTIIKGAGNWLDNASLDELRDRINQFIEDSEKQLVVIIDDVDRLDKDEIFQLFKLIKIAVDFKGIAYLIAFDDEMVSKVLGERFGQPEETGQSFIEKIIQVPIHLPLIDPQTLNRYILMGLDEVLDEFKIEISQEEIDRFRQSFDSEISQLIRSPRMANRYLNALKFILPLVGKEINYTDILILEAIRLLFPKEYNVLRRSRNELTGLQEDYFIDGADKKKKIQSYIEENFSKHGELVELIKDVFPEVKNAMQQYGGSYIDESSLKILKRAASMDYYERYFTYGIAPGDVSDQSILNVLKNKEVDEASATIRSIINKYNGDTVVDKLITYAKNQTDGKQTALTLISTIDAFDDKESSKFMRSQVHRISDLIFELVKNYSGSKVNLIIELMDKINDPNLLTYYIRDMRLAYTDEKGFLKPAEYKRVQKAFVEKMDILTNSRKKILHKTNDNYLTIHLYSFWKEIIGQDAFNEFLNPHIKSSGDALELITMFLSTWHGDGVSKRGDLDSAAFNFMKQNIDVNLLHPIVLKYNKNKEVDNFIKFNNGVNLVGNEHSTEFKKTLAKQFLFQYKKALEIETEAKGEEQTT